jgi:very-short-patch-repair endonuclease
MKRYDPKQRPITTKPRLHTSSYRRWEVLGPVARQMRHEPTEAERRLWNALRGKALGAKFRRQHVIDDFVVDCICIDANLVIEVDGPIHRTQAEYDAAREQHLRGCGYRILRFSNEDVMQRLNKVLETIRAALSPHPPAPSP